MFYYRNSSIDYEARINYKNCISSSLKTAAIFSDDIRGYDLVAGIDNKNASKLISNNNLVIHPPTSVQQPGFTMPTGDKTLVIRYKSINDASTSWVFGAPNNPRIILAEFLGKYQVYDGGWRNSKVVVEHDVYHTFVIVYKSGTGYLYKDSNLIHTWSNPYAGISNLLFSAGATHKTLYIEFFYAFYRPLSFDEVKSLSESPYQILKPRRKWYYFPDVSGLVSGSFAGQEGVDTGAWSGSGLVSGSFAGQEGVDTGAWSGSVPHAVTGTIGGTEAADVIFLTGGAIITGDMNVVDGQDTALFSTRDLVRIRAQFNATLARDKQFEVQV